VKILQAIFAAHVRNTLLKEHYVLELSNQDQNELVQSLLSTQSPLYDERWEKLRRLISPVVANL
jgi:hypothetical protein